MGLNKIFLAVGVCWNWVDLVVQGLYLNRCLEEFQRASYHQHHQGLSEDEQEDRFEALDKNGDLVLDGKDAAPPVEREKPKGP